MGASTSTIAVTTTALSATFSPTTSTIRSTTSAAVTTAPTTLQTSTLTDAPATIISVLTSTDASATTTISATAIPTAPVAAINSNNCTSWEFLTVRGNEDSPTDPFWMREFRNGVPARVKGGSLYELQYDARGADVITTLRSVIGGGILFTQYLTKRAEVCPNTKFIVAGYSQGAGVTVLGLNGLSRKVQNKIIGLVLWGSPFWLENRPENVGSARTGKGNYSGFGFKVPALLQSRTADICLYSDRVCTGATPLGFDTHIFFKWSEWESYSINFMVAKLRAAGFNQ